MLFLRPRLYNKLCARLYVARAFNMISCKSHVLPVSSSKLFGSRCLFRLHSTQLVVSCSASDGIGTGQAIESRATGGRVDGRHTMGMRFTSSRALSSGAAHRCSPICTMTADRPEPESSVRSANNVCQQESYKMAVAARATSSSRPNGRVDLKDVT